MTARLAHRRLSAGVLALAALGATAGVAQAAPGDGVIDVSTTVATSITVNAGDDIVFSTLPGEVSDREVSVVANDEYNLSVAATGTLPLEMKLDPAGIPPGTVAAGFGTYTALGATAAIGSRNSGITTDADVGGDKWLLDLRTALPLWTPAGTYSSLVTFTAVAQTP